MSTRRLSLAAAALAAAFFALSPRSAQAGPNLLPNSGFEQSAIEPVPALNGKQPQPLLPTGWAFEGAAGLFDHSPHGGAGGSARAAAISIPAGGKRDICGPEVGCKPNPTNGAKDEVSKTFSVNPAWRNALPIAVTAGRQYSVGASVSWTLATEKEGGAFGRVRWLNSSGVPISTSQAFSVAPQTPGSSASQDWFSVSGLVTAPAGATSAVVLFGARDDVFISKIQFDNVFFG